LADWSALWPSSVDSAKRGIGCGMGLTSPVAESSREMMDKPRGQPGVDHFVAKFIQPTGVRFAA
jgi:hypothetical protein